ncbi:MAG TPA: hypothetical protein VKF36_09350 [Syntrophorhabdales bacterium]|nr:hypothetical protein [Syntrophorhabdales bacterium]
MQLPKTLFVCGFWAQWPQKAPSNLMSFLQIALPGLLALSGHANPGLPRINARLGSDLKEGDRDWTDFFSALFNLVP